jgi:hypothetical protein
MGNQLSEDADYKVIYSKIVRKIGDEILCLKCNNKISTFIPCSLYCDYHLLEVWDKFPAEELVNSIDKSDLGLEVKTKAKEKIIDWFKIFKKERKCNCKDCDRLCFYEFDKGRADFPKEMAYYYKCMIGFGKLFCFKHYNLIESEIAKKFDEYNAKHKEMIMQTRKDLEEISEKYFK